MTLQQQSRLLTCHCLNVQIHIERHQASSLDSKQQQELTFLESKLQKEQEATRNSIKEFFQNSKYLKLSPDGIRINYECLCLKKSVNENLMIVFCTICDQNTHAIQIDDKSIFGNENDLFSPKPSDDQTTTAKPNQSKPLFVWAHSSLLSDENEISKLKSSSYSVALGIVLPANISFDSSSQEDDSENIEIDNVTSYVNKYPSLEMEITGKIKNFLENEKSLMQERIRLYCLEQENSYKKLSKMSFESRKKFFMLLESMEKRYDLSNRQQQKIQPHSNKNNDFDKENVITAAPDSTTLMNGNDNLFDDMYPVIAKNHQQLHQQPHQLLFSRPNVQHSQDVTKVVADSSSGFLFEIDDLDSQNLLLEQSDIEEIDGDLDERRDSFLPLKESNTFSNKKINNYQHNPSDEFASTASKARRFSQQKPFYQQQQNESEKYRYPVASSLPIQIPHFGRNYDREIEENSRLNPGESIADSIQKLARSVRNENNMLDDRPRRRLNTGDLIKSRPGFQY